MPYIKQSDRLELETNERNPQTAGELNYSFTRLVLNSSEDNITNLGLEIRNLIGTFIEEKGLCYQTINDIGGAIINSIAEFERRTKSSEELDSPYPETGIIMLVEEYYYFYDNVAAPYEDIKIKENGDVY